ncbi:hypothetical protein OROHE_025351 [Orobanche hederae]
MESSKCIFGALFLVISMLLSLINGDPLVPALCIFGDSVVDVGNNNNLSTLIKANFLPYGRDFVTHRPTGRFSNGKLAIDFTAQYLGFNSYPPAYLSQDARGRNIMTGVNFASAASGYYDITAQLYSAQWLSAQSMNQLVMGSTLVGGQKLETTSLPLSRGKAAYYPTLQTLQMRDILRALTLQQQLAFYKDWQKRVVNLVGRAKANAIFSGGIHLISAGSSDFIQNYYINPILNTAFTPDQFSDILMRSYSTLIQNLYDLGARRIGVTTLPPTGCLPAAITLFGLGSNQCVERLNRDAVSFNNKLNTTSQILKTSFSGLRLVVFDIYQPLLDFITKPSDNGFFESRRACCGTGTIETSFLCNERSVGTCSNATGYVFWDGFHPSESANEKLAQSLLGQGFALIS